MSQSLLDHLAEQTRELHGSGLYKSERVVTSPQQAVITVKGGQEVINLCANNYLGLANHPELIKSAQHALESRGYGMASVRFIVGTQQVHKELEQRISEFLETDDTILYSSCFDANTGLFETILSAEDAVISDQLNHASIIDGIRLCKATRYRYLNSDMNDLEEKLKEAQSSRYRLIATDGVFSMDGSIAKLQAICNLAERYDALVMVDDSHAVGFVGEGGRGTPELCNVIGRVDIITGTLGKALGGASGGYTSGRREIIEWLRQRSRPYLFSNTLAPVIAATSLKVLELVKSSGELRQQLRSNSQHFRTGMEAAGFTLVAGEHPIIPVMIGDAQIAGDMAERLLEEGVYVVSFSFPVVPHGQARIRTQMTAAHTTEQLDRAIDAFTRVGRKLGIIK